MGEQLKDKYDIIFSDITSNCNLRCPFCLNDWTVINGNTFMSKETFRKIVTLIPLIREGGCFGLSCLFEPTLHPDFIELLKMIPEPERKKVFFTTNLAKPLSDDLLHELAAIGISFINISLDSLTPTVFESLRKGAKFLVFMDNLKRLTMVFRSSPNPPTLHYITVLCRENVGEVESLITETTRNYLSVEHEFRCFWQYNHQDQTWVKNHSISLNDWERVRDKLAKLPYKYLLRPYDPQPYSPPSYFGLFVSSSGMIYPAGLPANMLLNINHMESPHEFFKQFVLLHSLNIERGLELSRIRSEYERLGEEQHPSPVLKSQLVEMKQELASIEERVGWRLLARVRQIRMKLFPQGSRRESLWLLWISFLGVCVDQGTGIAVGKVVSNLRRKLEVFGRKETGG